jgi:hypothetical protein
VEKYGRARQASDDTIRRRKDAMIHSYIMCIASSLQDCLR